MYKKGKLGKNNSCTLNGNKLKVQDTATGPKAIVTNRYGKKYNIFLRETPNGTLIGEQMFKRYFVGVKVYDDDSCSVYIKKVASSRPKRSYRRTRSNKGKSKGKWYSRRR
jgi:hypothetical protein